MNTGQGVILFNTHTSQGIISQHITKTPSKADQLGRVIIFKSEDMFSNLNLKKTLLLQQDSFNLTLLNQTVHLTVFPFVSVLHTTCQKLQILIPGSFFFSLNLCVYIYGRAGSHVSGWVCE